MQMLPSCLLLLAITLNLASSQCEDSQLNVGIFHSCQADNLYPSGTPVRPIVRQKEAPGLPEWLTVSQFNSTSPVFIHGTPSEEGPLTLEIVILNEVTFESVTTEVDFTISSLEGDILQSHELYIANIELVEFLSSGTQTLFYATMSRAYQEVTGAVPLLLRVNHPSSRGIPVPPPPAKHGVIVNITPGVDLQLSMSPNSMPCLSSFSQVFADNGFELNSCSVTDFPEATTSPPSATRLPDDDRSSPPSSGSNLTLIIIIVVGVLILLLIVTSLAFVFFGGRRYTVSDTKKSRQSAMQRFSKETSLGPVSAQTHLRDLAQPVNSVPAAAGREKEEQERPQSQILEFQDLTDYSPLDDGDPPPYTYPAISHPPPTRTA